MAEESGTLDILVNNAASIHDALIDPGGFWEKPLELADILDVGLRSAYVASYFAAPLMVRARRGLITFVSSFGSSCYMHGPAYGAQKVGRRQVRRRHGGRSCAARSRHGLAVARAAAHRAHGGRRPQPAGPVRGIPAQAETPQFNGRIIHALASDPELMSLSGQTFISAELAQRYGITEEGGRVPPSYREMLGAPRRPHPAKVM